MILQLVAITPDAQWRDFSCYIDELDLAFEVLSSISRQGDTLVEACVIDQESRIQLPVEAFDGQLFTPSIQQLKQQWEQQTFSE